MARIPSEYLQLSHGGDDTPTATPSHAQQDGLAETEHELRTQHVAYGAGEEESSVIPPVEEESYDSEGLQAEYETEDLSDIPDEEFTTAEGEEGEEEEEEEEAGMEVDSAVSFDATGLKEIGNLASWTVSSFKPGCGIDALRDDDMTMFWQSDGPQPHHLNIHFSRLVSILAIRLYLDFEVDESYTPTRILLQAGTGYHDLIPFSTLSFTQPKGWQDVDLSNVGGGPRGDELRCFLVQVKIVENHQNGKDTHLRGLKLYAKDERYGKVVEKKAVVGGEADSIGRSRGQTEDKESGREGMLTEPDWMSVPELR